MSFLETNKLALEKLKEFYPDKNLPTAYGDDPNGFGADLRTAGIVCSVCGKNSVTGKNLAFYNFEANVKDYACQNNFN